MTIQDQLHRDEGIRLRMYRCTAGKWTIGYGRNLTDRGIFPDEADLMLENDLRTHRMELLAKLPWAATLDDARFGVLLNMAFNMGVPGLMAFTQTLALIESGDFNAAAEEMLKSKWATQVGQRANRLSTQLRTGVWT